ncbi:hypothetical protein [Coxiella endosymbiont of Ornithodoros amblus]|nr:hypothetical protein [Coxiella endosymbiont of Ornithodoros amblus]
MFSFVNAKYVCQQIDGVNENAKDLTMPSTIYDIKQHFPYIDFDHFSLA